MQTLNFKEKKDILVQRKAEVIILSGGGAKIGAYSGVCGALHDNLLARKSIKAYVGTSAGALAGALLACGIQPKMFRNLLFATNFPETLDIGENVVSEFFSVPTQSDGMKLYAELHKWICKSITEGLNDVNRDIIKNENDKSSFFALERKVASTWTIQPITFKDLDLLHRYFPEKFKALIIIAAHENKDEVKQFDAKHTPDVEIARAAHAAAAIPIVFKSVIIDGVSYIDGGVKDNTPTGYFVDEFDENRLIFAFSDSDGLLPQALHNIKPKNKVNTTYFNTISDILGHKLHYNINNNFELVLKKIRDYHALQTISIQTWNLSFHDFKDAERIKRELDMMGYLDTHDFLFAHDLHQIEKCDHENDTRLSILAKCIEVYSLIPDGKKSVDDGISSQFQQYESGKITSLSLYHWLRQKSSESSSNIYTFVLTRALEIHRGLLPQNTLQQECIEWGLKKTADSKQTTKHSTPKSSLPEIIFSLELDSLRSHHNLKNEYDFIFESARNMQEINKFPQVKIFIDQIINLEPLYNQLYAKYNNRHTKKIELNRRNQGLGQNIAYFFCPAFHNTVPETSKREDFILLRDIRKAMIHAYKLCLIPNTRGAPITWVEQDYQQNIADLALLVPKLYGHGSKSLQYLGVALLLLCLAATLFFTLTMLKFINALPLIYCAIGLAIAATGSISSCLLIITQRQKGLAKISDELLKSPLNFVPLNHNNRALT